MLCLKIFIGPSPALASWTLLRQRLGRCNTLQRAGKLLFRPAASLACRVALSAAQRHNTHPERE
jgi:hypothetical protein